MTCTLHGVRQIPRPVKRRMDEVEEDESRQKVADRCELCGREEVLECHHLIPRSRHRKARTKRIFSRQEMRSRIIWVCSACHEQIHRLLTNQELAEHYHSLEVLREHPRVAKFIAWISKKPVGYQL